MCTTEPNEEDLKVILIQKENEWKKDKALYEQRIQLLEIQLEDYKNREQNQKRLNETISIAISDIQNPSKKYYTEFQKSLEAQNKDLQSNKARHMETLQRYEMQIREFQEQIAEKDTFIRDMELLHQKQQIQSDHRVMGLEQERSQLIMYQFIYISEIQKLKEQFQRLDDQTKQREQQIRVASELELQRIKDQHLENQNLKQQDYEQKYQQLNQLYQNEKEQLQQRINKCQNTIKKYQTHIESNIDVQSMQQKHDEQIQQLKQEMHEQQVQFQYDKKSLNKQIDELQGIVKQYNKGRESITCDNHILAYQGSTSKKQSAEMVRFRQSIIAQQESPVQCKSFHIGPNDLKIQRSSQGNQMINKSFEKSNQNRLNDSMPIPLEDFNNIKSKKLKSQSTSSIPTNNPQLTSYLQDASILHQKEESFHYDSNQNTISQQHLLKASLSNQQTQRQTEYLDPQRRSTSQQGLKSSANNLQKILQQQETNYQNRQQGPKINTSFNKVPTFSQHQLSSLRNSQQQFVPSSTTLRMNDNHLNHLQSIKARYLNQEEIKMTDTSLVKQNKENQLPSKSVYINNEIKFLIGKLLQAKGKLSSEMEQMEKQTQKSFRYIKHY